MKRRKVTSLIRAYPLVSIVMSLILIFTLCPTTQVQASITVLPDEDRNDSFLPAPIQEPVPAVNTTLIPLPPSSEVSATVSPDQDTEIKSPSQKITLFVPQGAVSTTTNIDLIEKDPGVQQACR